tara:strand:- start:5069 stop:6595 length:1527 start_codon:yes stop_codon:yes gene_type:complete
MSDILYEGGSNIGTFGDNAAPGAPAGYTGGSPVDTGDLRRKYNFGDRVSELSIASDPFFRFVSKVAKKPTDDPQFKFTERRDSWHKRYAYVITGGATYATITSTAIAASVAGSPIQLRFGCDYASNGNKTNIVGKTVDYIPGGAGTTPTFFLEDQIIKVPVADTNGGSVADYLIVKVGLVGTTGNTTDIAGTVIKGVPNGGSYLMGLPASLDGAGTDVGASEESLAPYKAYVVGSVFEKGTGYPETWKDQPFSTSYGQTQIWKTSMAMTNTDRATILKYEGNEWARIWKEKLVEHKWDIEQSLLFGSQNETYRTTQGAVDWILNNGNAFTLDVTKKSQDHFLDDLSALLDPRYNNSMATVFFCSTAVYNWLHKLSGYFANNLGMVNPASGNTSPDPSSANSLGRADLAVTGRKKVLGLDTTTITTVYGDMNVVRNIHLDGTNIAMLGINMKNCAYRPLVGNGINRDTSVYVGVQTLENSGVDRRVDQIITEAGMEWSMPESHAVWKNA